MNARSTFVTIGCGVALIAGTAFGQGMPPGHPGMPPGHPGMPGAGAKPMVPPEVSKPIELTDAKMQGFFAAADELEKLGDDIGAKAGGDPSKPASFANSLRASQEGMAILNKNGFKDVTEFQQVGYNAAMAYAVLEQGGKQAVQEKLAKAEAEQAKAMEKLKQQLTPEQFEMMKGHLGAAMGTVKTMQDVPEGNVELMKKYSAQMEKLGED